MSKREEYNQYVQRIEADNFARDMYDGDTYMGYEDPMTFKEWSEDQAPEPSVTVTPSEEQELREWLADFARGNQGDSHYLVTAGDIYDSDVKELWFIIEAYANAKVIDARIEELEFRRKHFEVPQQIYTEDGVHKRLGAAQRNSFKLKEIASIDARLAQLQAERNKLTKKKGK